MIESHSSVSVETDIGLCFSKKRVAKIHPRSSLLISSIKTGAGVADLITEEMSRSFCIIYPINKLNLGDRITQVIFEKIALPILEEVKEFSDTTERGEGRFGSTDGC